MSSVRSNTYSANLGLTQSPNLHATSQAMGRIHAGPSVGDLASSGVAPLVDTQELRPPYSPNGSKPSGILQMHDPETGEIHEFEPSGRAGILTKRYTITDHQNTRAERWAMKWSVDSLLRGYRQWKCHRWRIPGKNIEVKLSLEHQKAFYAGFECCGSVWGCPLCAPKITERRRVDVSTAIDSAKEQELNVMLATFTIPHGLGDNLDQIRTQLLSAWSKMNQCRAGRSVFKMLGVKGWIRVFEVTLGSNGWHPHFHALIFLNSSYRPAQVKEALYPIWLDGCRKSGLEDPSQAHGLQVDDGEKAAQYVTKWGMDSELTKGHLKKGKSSVNPWDLLRVHTFGIDGLNPDLRKIVQALDINKDRAAALWLSFFWSFRGTRQLYWSNGLRKLLGLSAEKTDQELAEEEMDKAAALLATLTDYQRFDLIRTKNLPALLTLAEDAPGMIPEFLKSIEHEPNA